MKQLTYRAACIVIALSLVLGVFLFFQTYWVIKQHKVFIIDAQQFRYLLILTGVVLVGSVVALGASKSKDQDHLKHLIFAAFIAFMMPVIIVSISIGHCEMLSCF